MPLPTSNLTIHKHKFNHSSCLADWLQEKIQAPCHHPRHPPPPACRWSLLVLSLISRLPPQVCSVPSNAKLFEVTEHRLLDGVLVLGPQEWIKSLFPWNSHSNRQKKKRLKIIHIYHITHYDIYIHIYVYIYMCMCMCIKSGDFISSEENKARWRQRVTESLYRGQGQPHQLVTFGQRLGENEGGNLQAQGAGSAEAWASTVWALRETAVVGIEWSGKFRESLRPDTSGHACVKDFGIYPKVKVKVTQSCPTLCDPMDYTVHRILQARILEWVAFPFFGGSSQPRDWNQVSHITGRFFTNWAPREALGFIWSKLKTISGFSAKEGHDMLGGRYYSRPEKRWRSCAGSSLWVLVPRVPLAWIPSSPHHARQIPGPPSPGSLFDLSSWVGSGGPSWGPTVPLMSSWLQLHHCV